MNIENALYKFIIIIIIIKVYMPTPVRKIKIKK